MIWQDSWCKKTAAGVGICVRWHMTYCKSGDSCVFAHCCPIPGPDKKPCEGKHSPPGQFFPADGHGKFFLDICAGFSAPVSTALTKLGGARTEPVDLLFGDHCNLLDDSVMANLMHLAYSGLVSAALAAPYCCRHSVAKLIRRDLQPFALLSFCMVYHPTHQTNSAWWRIHSFCMTGVVIFLRPWLRVVASFCWRILPPL